MRKKTLGNLTPMQLRRTLNLAKGLPTLANLRTLLKSRPKFQRALDEAGLVFSWAWAYELSTLELIALLVWGIDEQDEILAIAESDDPQEAMLNRAKREEEPAIEADDIPLWRKLLVLELLIALIMCFRCYRSYSQSLCDLVAKARGGNQEALLCAVRIDPTVLSTPSVTEIVSLSVLGSEKKFLKRVKGAYATPRQKLTMYTDLRFVEVLLHEAGAFASNVPAEHIYDVVVNGLALYDHRGADARKGLMTLFKRWRDSATT